MKKKIVKNFKDNNIPNVVEAGYEKVERRHTLHLSQDKLESMETTLRKILGNRRTVNICIELKITTFGTFNWRQENYLEHPIPAAPVAPPGQQVPPQALAAHATWVKRKKKVDELKAMYSKQAEQELLQTVREFHTSKLEEGQSVSSHVFKMKGYIDNLERLGQPVGKNLAVSLILVSLNKNFDSFVQNYNMHDMGKTMNELHAMLKLHEKMLPKKDDNPALHAIRARRVQKNQKNKPHKAAKGGHGKGKGKMGNASNNAPFASNNAPFASKPKTPPQPKKDNPAKDAICHQCGEGLQGSKKLKPGAFSLGDGHRAAVEAIGTYHLELPIGLVIVLNNFHYAKTHVWLAGLTNAKKKCFMMARKPYSHQVERVKYLLGLIHTDVCGPFKIVSRQGASYFVTFTNDFSRYGYAYLLKHKHEVFETFKHFEKEVENQLGKTIKSLHFDRGGEYMSQEFLDHLKEHRIITHRTPPYTPQNNGVSGRRNRTLLDIVRSMMSQTTLPKTFWDYALETAARILNMVPTKKVDKTPYEIWHGQAPKLSYLKVWGCEAFVKRDTITKPDNLDPRSFKCIFVGYPKETMGYSFYNLSENKVFVARNVKFFESKLLDLKESGSVEDLELIQEEDTNPSVDTGLNHEEDDQEIDEPQSDINPTRKSSRTRRAPDRMCLYVDAVEHELGDLGEPANYKAALLDLESKKWHNAMNVEMQSMKDNDVWVLVELPPNARTVGSKWLFKKKTDMDDIRTIRILIAIATYYEYEIWQMDVKTAFLNGHLSEEVYMEQPEGFVNPKYPNHVCKLKHSIYELKHASRQWNKRFDDEIKKFGFTQNPDEPYVYLKASGSYKAILILYVDDIFLMGNNIPMLQDVKSYLGRSFAMKDLGEAAYILGIKIYRDRSKRLIEKMKLSKSQGASTPAEKQRMQNISYFLAVGSIMYAVRCTRPGVVFTQNMTSRFQQNPGEEHWTAVKNILKYIRNTKDMFLVYGDAEYIAAFDASKEPVWIRKFIFGLGIVPTIEEPISMYCDNMRAIAISKDDGVTKGARHFRAKVHYLRETIKLGDVKIEKIDTDDNLADLFTKGLAFPKHSELTRNIGLLLASGFM
nr:hypothetical protein [Tanacetum cinerariifolium]